MATLRGRLDDLLHSPAHDRVADAWLAVVLTDPHRPQAAMERLRHRFPHTLTLAFEPEGRAAPPRAAVPHVSGRSDLDVALGFVEEVRALEPTTEEELLLQLACDACRLDDDPDADLRSRAVG
jgi:exonuclease SbcD